MMTLMLPASSWTDPASSWPPWWVAGESHSVNTTCRYRPKPVTSRDIPVETRQAVTSP